MNSDALICFGLWAGLSAFGLVFVMRRRWPGRFGWYPTSAGLGNALQALQAITQPRVQHVIEEMVDEDTDDDPVEHLHWQARRLRRGRLAGPIKVRLRR
jgi:hypothetical protein